MRLRLMGSALGAPLQKVSFAVTGSMYGKYYANYQATGYSKTNNLETAFLPHNTYDPMWMDYVIFGL